MRSWKMLGSYISDHFINGVTDEMITKAKTLTHYDSIYRCDDGNAMNIKLYEYKGFHIGIGGRTESGKFSNIEFEIFPDKGSVTCSWMDMFDSYWFEKHLEIAEFIHRADILGDWSILRNTKVSNFELNITKEKLLLKFHDADNQGNSVTVSIDKERLKDFVESIVLCAVLAYNEYVEYMI